MYGVTFYHSANRTKVLSVTRTVFRFCAAMSN